MSLVRKFALDTRGATSIEYGLIAGLIALAIIAGVRLIGSSLSERYYMPAANGIGGS